MKPVVIERKVECASDVCAMWSAITDTDRLNRGAGAEPVRLTPLADQTAARYIGKTNLGGFDVEYEELPWEWKEFERFSITRRMRTGPVTNLSMAYEIAPSATGGCQVIARVTLIPRFAILRPVIAMSGALSVRKVVAEIARMDQENKGKPRPEKRAPVDAERLARVGRELALSGDPEVSERLVAHVRDASDHDLARIRPYELADEWSVDRVRVLTTCLHAVAAGLLELRWDIVCPSCRTASTRLQDLSSLTAQGHCQLCDLGFDVDLDRAVEATFSPNPSLRTVEEGTYCSGGPARTPHVFAQVVVGPGERASLPVPAEEGRFTLFFRGGASATVKTDANAPEEVEVAAAEDLSPRHVEVRSSGVIRILNTGSDARHAKLERPGWSSASATAHEVSTLAPFRRLFSSEVLQTGTLLRVARVGLLFTDLTGSTALYSRAGDAAAYRLVSDHFKLLGSIIERHRGTIVKTIGDAVMAAFVDDLQGLDAACDLLEGFHRFRGGRAHCDEVFLKIGFFAGPSYVVSANGALDYFGQTVNVAARLQSKAESSELVVDEALATRALASGHLGKLVLVERFDAVLKGLDSPVRCARLRLGALVEQSGRPEGDAALGARRSTG